MPRQSTNVETPAPGTESVPPESYAKMAQSMRDNASAGNEAGLGSMEKAARDDARKVKWNRRSRMASIYDPPSRTDHVNKSYQMADGGVVPPAGTIGAFPSGIMPKGAPLPEPEPQKAEQPEKEKPRILTPAEQIGLYGSHR